MRLSPPLRRVSSHLLESEPSRTRSRLSEPLWGDGALRADFMVRASQLNAILEREVSESGSVDSLDTVCARSPRARELLDALHAAAAALHHPSPLSLLEESNLALMCPAAAHFLGSPDVVYRDESVPLLHEQWEQLGALSQLACVAAQLTADMDAGRHKYCAHKLALLYHAAVHLARLRDAELEGRIRQHFEDVKLATEEPNFSQLPPRLVEWVRATCAAVHERVAPQPRQLFAANAPRLAAFLSPPRAEDALRRLQSSSVG